MSPYTLSTTRGAQRGIGRIPANQRERMRDAIRRLASEPRPAGCRKLKGREGWRIRVGDYRVIYRVDDEAREVLVVDIGHRKDVYR